MQPSSLVFVAIILGWAAFLLPQWVHRRESLGQSRGDDRDSSALRVLDRRRRASAGPSTTPLLPDPRTGDPCVDPLAEPAPREGAVDDGDVAGDGGAGRRPVTAVTAPSAAAMAARRRARVLGTLLALTTVAWLASLAVPAASGAAWALTALLGLDLAALVVTGRQRAVRRARAEREHRREQAQRRAAARRRADAAGRERARPEPAGHQRTGHERAHAAVPEVAEVAEPSRPATGSIAIPRPERASERVARELDEGAASDAWTPVPVPPPTYTLKPAVPRPEPAPLDLPDAPTPEPTEPPAAEAAPQAPRPWESDRTFADDLDLDAVLERRRAVNG